MDNEFTKRRREEFEETLKFYDEMMKDVHKLDAMSGYVFQVQHSPTPTITSRFKDGKVDCDKCGKLLGQNEVAVIIKMGKICIDSWRTDLMPNSAFRMMCPDCYKKIDPDPMVAPGYEDFNF